MTRRSRSFWDVDLRRALASFRNGNVYSRALIVGIATANVVLMVITIVGFFVSDAGYDWLIFVEAGRRVVAGGLYDWSGIYAYTYSPLLAYAFAVLAPIGFLGWSLLHIAVLGFLRDRWLTAITLLSWPFWADVYNGNTMTFVFVAAVGAFRLEPKATGAFLAMSLLMPRPVMVPLVLWILWQHRLWRARFLVMAVVYVVLVLATGYGAQWTETLLGVTRAVAASSRDLGPGALIGGWWLIAGSALAVILTLRGHLGLASVAASPYWLPQYFLMLLLELVPRRSATSRRGFGASLSD